MNVLKGDIGLVLNNPNQTIHATAEKVMADHSFMIAADGELAKDTMTVHLTWGGLETTEFSGQGSVIAICRGPDLTLAGRALGIALSWARVLPSVDHKEQGGRNTYDFNRGKGVMHDLAHKGELDFGFDALYRALKWSERIEAPFSHNKGLTCAAWTVACYQAAALLGPPIEDAARRKAAELARSLRNPKQKAAEREKSPGKVSGEELGKAAHYRESANVGAKEPDAFSQVVGQIKKSNLPDMTFIESIMTKPIVVDARFLHSDGLYRRLAKSDSGWKVYLKDTHF